MQQLSPPL